MFSKPHDSLWLPPQDKVEPIDLEEPEPEEENNEPPMESVPETANSVVKSLRSTVLPILRHLGDHDYRKML